LSDGRTLANKKLKAIVGSMTDAQKAEAVKSTREMARNAAEAAIKETVSGDNSWVHEEDNATLFFDVAGYSKPNVLVSYHSPERPSIVVDVCGSIRSNAKNLGHPVVVEAITRYAGKLSKADAKSVIKTIGDSLSGRDGEEPPAPNRRLDRGLAERRLQSIYRALIAGAKSRSRRAVLDFECT
jgi:hypothetical protein